MINSTFWINSTFHVHTALAAVGETSSELCLKGRVENQMSVFTYCKYQDICKGSNYDRLSQFGWKVIVVCMFGTFDNL